MKYREGQMVTPKVKYGVQDAWFGVNCKVISRWFFNGNNMYLIDNGLDSPENCGRKVYVENDLRAR